MKKFLFLLLIIPALCWGDAALIGEADRNVASDANECVGYETYSGGDCNSDPCACTATPGETSAQAPGNARTINWNWSADTDGTLSRVKVYLGGTVSGSVTAVVYVGTTLKATATMASTTTDSWNWSNSLVAESGQSLSFSTSDNLYFGVCVTASVYIGRTYNESDENYWQADIATCATDPASYTENTTRELGVLLEYN